MQEKIKESKVCRVTFVCVGEHYLVEYLGWKILHRIQILRSSSPLFSSLRNKSVWTLPIKFEMSTFFTSSMILVLRFVEIIYSFTLLTCSPIKAWNPREKATMKSKMMRENLRNVWRTSVNMTTYIPRNGNLRRVDNRFNHDMVTDMAPI